MDIAYMRPDNGSLNGSNFVAENQATAIPYLIILSLASFTGTVGNILVILSIWMAKELRVVGNILVINLALADLCVTAFVDPFSIVGTIKGEIWFQDKPVLCEIIASVCLTACYCTLLTIASITINRYIHICRHEFYPVIYSFRNTILICVGLWCVSFLIEMPNFFGWGDHVYDKKTLSCVWDRTADHSYSIFFSSVAVIFPIILMTILYALMWRQMKAMKRKGFKRRYSIEPTIPPDQWKELDNCVLLIYIGFIVCWTPYAFVVAVDYNDSYPQEAHFYTILLAHANSSLNSILFFIGHKHFRDTYLQLLGCKKK